MSQLRSRLFHCYLMVISAQIACVPRHENQKKSHSRALAPEGQDATSGGDDRLVLCLDQASCAGFGFLTKGKGGNSARHPSTNNDDDDNADDQNAAPPADGHNEADTGVTTGVADPRDFQTLQPMSRNDAEAVLLREGSTKGLLRLGSTRQPVLSMMISATPRTYAYHTELKLTPQPDGRNLFQMIDPASGALTPGVPVSIAALETMIKQKFGLEIKAWPAANGSAVPAVAIDQRDQIALLSHYLAVDRAGAEAALAQDPSLGFVLRINKDDIPVISAIRLGPPQSVGHWLVQLHRIGDEVFVNQVDEPLIRHHISDIGSVFGTESQTPSQRQATLESQIDRSIVGALENRRDLDLGIATAREAGENLGSRPFLLTPSQGGLRLTRALATGEIVHETLKISYDADNGLDFFVYHGERFLAADLIGRFSNQFKPTPSPVIEAALTLMGVSNEDLTNMHYQGSIALGTGLSAATSHLSLYPELSAVVVARTSNPYDGLLRVDRRRDGSFVATPIPIIPRKESDGVGLLPVPAQENHQRFAQVDALKAESLAGIRSILVLGSGPIPLEVTKDFDVVNQANGGLVLARRSPDAERLARDERASPQVQDRESRIDEFMMRRSPGDVMQLGRPSGEVVLVRRLTNGVAKEVYANSEAAQARLQQLAAPPDQARLIQSSRHGYVSGSFNIPHKGHLQLISRAAQENGAVTVLIVGINARGRHGIDVGLSEKIMNAYVASLPPDLAQKITVQVVRYANPYQGIFDSVTQPPGPQANLIREHVVYTGGDRENFGKKEANKFAADLGPANRTDVFTVSVTDRDDAAPSSTQFKKLLANGTSDIRAYAEFLPDSLSDQQKSKIIADLIANLSSVQK